MSQNRYFPFKKTSSPTPPTPVLEPLTFYNNTGLSNTICLYTSGSPQAITLQYNKNDTGWTDYSVGTQIELNDGDFVRLSGDNDHFSTSTSKFYYFHTTKAGLQCSGDVQSLMNFRTVLPNGCYYSLLCGCNLAGCTPKMTVTDVGVSACYKMFRANNWTDACELPATGLANKCYQSMFNGCTKLTAAPPVLPATTLAPSCYVAMFQGCSSLLIAPLLPAPVLTTACYNSMFYQCSSLMSVSAYFTAWGSSYGALTTFWLNNTNNSSNSQFYCYSALDTTVRDNDHIPQGWTVVNI